MGQSTLSSVILADLGKLKGIITFMLTVAINP
jgi:hypothetical protein